MAFLFVTDHTYNNVGGGCRNEDFITVSVGFSVFSLANTVHRRFMHYVDLVFGFRSSLDRAKLADVQTQALDSFAIGPSLLNAVDFGQLVQTVDDLNRQLGIRRIGAVLFLNRRVNVDDGFPGRFAMQVHTHLKDFFKRGNTTLADLAGEVSSGIS